MPQPRRTPGVVIGAGVLLIIYGALLLTCGLCGGAGLAISDPNADAMIADEVPGFKVMKFGEPVSNLLVGITMIASGVGLFQLWPVARILAYFVLIYQIFFVIMRNLFQVIFVFPVMERMFNQMQAQNQQPMPFNMGDLIKGTMWGAVVVLVLLHLAFIGPTLLLLSLAPARKAFSGEAPPDEDRGEHGPRHDDGYDDDDDYNRPTPRPKDPGDTGIKEGY